MVGIGLGEGEGVEVWSGTRVVRMLISTGKKVGEEGSAPTAQTTSIIHSATSCTHRTTPIIHPTTSCTHRNSPSRHAFHHHLLHPLHCSQHQSYDFLSPLIFRASRNLTLNAEYPEARNNAEWRGMARNNAEYGAE